MCMLIDKISDDLWGGKEELWQLSQVIFALEAWTAGGFLIR